MPMFLPRPTFIFLIKDLPKPEGMPLLIRAWLDPLPNRLHRHDQRNVLKPTGRPSLPKRTLKPEPTSLSSFLVHLLLRLLLTISSLTIHYLDLLNLYR